MSKKIPKPHETKYNQGYSDMRNGRRFGHSSSAHYHYVCGWMNGLGDSYSDFISARVVAKKAGKIVRIKNPNMWRFARHPVYGRRSRWVKMLAEMNEHYHETIR